MYTAQYEISEEQLRQLWEFYFDCWWTAERSEAEARAIIAASHVTVLVDTTTERVVGFARILTDGVAYGYIADVMVRPELRSTGLGRLLMAAVVAHPALAQVRKVELTCRPEMDGFYAHFGFHEPASGSHALRRDHRSGPYVAP